MAVSAIIIVIIGYYTRNKPMVPERMCFAAVKSTAAWLCKQHLSLITVRKSAFRVGRSAYAATIRFNREARVTLCLILPGADV